MVLLNRVVGTAPDEAALRLAQQLSELWRSARHLASAKQVGQQRRGVLRHPHLESQLARREMQRELEERAALLLGCGQFPDPPGQPGREPERQAAVDRFPVISLTQQPPPFSDPVGLISCSQRARDRRFRFSTIGRSRSRTSRHSPSSHTCSRSRISSSGSPSRFPVVMTSIRSTAWSSNSR
jgi:hypothetical protein